MGIDAPHFQTIPCYSLAVRRSASFSDERLSPCKDKLLSAVCEIRNMR